MSRLHACSASSSRLLPKRRMKTAFTPARTPSFSAGPVATTVARTMRVVHRRVAEFVERRNPRDDTVRRRLTEQAQVSDEAAECTVDWSRPTRRAEPVRREVARRSSRDAATRLHEQIVPEARHKLSSRRSTTRTSTSSPRCSTDVVGEHDSAGEPHRPLRARHPARGPSTSRCRSPPGGESLPSWEEPRRCRWA